MTYEFYFHPVKGIKVMVYPTGNVGDGDKRFMAERLDNDLIKKPFSTRQEARDYFEKEKGYVREHKVTRTSNKNYSGGV
jgi:hypothetical protein